MYVYKQIVKHRNISDTFDTDSVGVYQLVNLGVSVGCINSVCVFFCSVGFRCGLNHSI